jgi:hypothetical protein
MKAASFIIHRWLLQRLVLSNQALRVPTPCEKLCSPAGSGGKGRHNGSGFELLLFPVLHVQRLD